MTIYTCENTFEAMMACIYDAWASKEGHQNIRLKAEPVGDMELFCEYRPIQADTEKAKKVVFFRVYYDLPLCYVRTSGQT